MLERRDGVHFLTDYYALLKLQRFEPSNAAIKTAYRAFMMLYNVDRHRGLAGEQEAERMTRLGNTAYRTLTDESKKNDYDEKLRNWQGPISDDGIPVINILDPFWAVEGTVRKAPKLLTEAEERQFAISQSGYDPGLLGFLASARHNSGEGALLFLRSKARELNFRRSLIELCRMNGGLAMPNLSGVPAVPQLEALLAIERSKTEAALEATRQAIESNEIKALPTGSDTSPYTQLEQYSSGALEQFDATASRVIRFGEDYDKTLAELTTPVYSPTQKVFHDNVVLVLIIGDTEMRFAFRIEGSQVNQDENLPDEQLEELDHPDKAKSFIAKGWNIMYVYLPAGKPPMEAINEALELHYSKTRAAAEHEVNE